MIEISKRDQRVFRSCFWQCLETGLNLWFFLLFFGEHKVLLLQVYVKKNLNPPGGCLFAHLCSGTGKGRGISWKKSYFKRCLKCNFWSNCYIKGHMIDIIYPVGIKLVFCHTQNTQILAIRTKGKHNKPK